MRFSVKFITLAAILINFLGLQNAFAENNTASLNLELKLPKENILNLDKNGLYKPVHKLDIGQLAAFDSRGFEQILVIYTTYRTLAQSYPLLVESIAIADHKLRLMNAKTHSLEISIKDIRYALETSELSRELTENIFKETNKNHKAQLRKQRAKTILLAAGTGIGALAVGFIVGWFISN